MSVSKTPLSIVYITLNAEKYLDQSLTQASKLTNDIVIVDSGSTDNTYTIADRFHVNWVEQEWLGFAAQKQLAIDSAQHQWVLFLDSDEILSADAITVISELMSKGIEDGHDHPVAYSFPRKNWFQGKWIRYGTWWPDRVTRLVNRKCGHMKPVPVHECWIAEGEVVALDASIEHYSYENYSQLTLKADQYSTLAAQQLFAQGRASKTWEPLTHAIASFIKVFVLKRGYKDGIEGAAIAYTTALASFMKYAKLQELQRTHSPD